MILPTQAPLANIALLINITTEFEFGLCFITHFRGKVLSFWPLLHLIYQKNFWAAHECEASLTLADDLARQDCYLGFSKNTQNECFCFPYLLCSVHVQNEPEWRWIALGSVHTHNDCLGCHWGSSAARPSTLARPPSTRYRTALSCRYPDCYECGLSATFRRPWWPRGSRMDLQVVSEETPSSPEYHA